MAALRSAVNSGLTNTSVSALTLSGSNLFAGTDGGVWRRTLEITSVREIAGGELSRSFELKQNYSNPFNPSTTIKFRIPISNHIWLRVFDILGKEVATLVNEELKAGTYETTFNASGLASGVYLYRLQSGKFVETRKFMLLR